VAPQRRLDRQPHERLLVQAGASGNAAGQVRLDALWGLDVFDRKVLPLGATAARSRPAWPAGRAPCQPWQDRLRNRLRLSAYRLGPEDLDAYLKRIAAFGPASIYGYSTAVSLLAQSAAARGFRCPSLKLATLSGEPAYPHLVETIERGFGVPAVVEYGAVECGFIAGEGADRRLRVRRGPGLR